MKLYDINPSVTQALAVCAPPQVILILPILVIMYIVVYSMYCKKCAFIKTGLEKDKCMQVWGCVEWG